MIEELFLLEIMIKLKRGEKGVQFILNHIKRIWNSDNELNFEYDRKWIMKMVYGYKMKTMLYLKGKQGRGKTGIVKFLMKVIGDHNCITLSNDSVFMSDFNGPLVGKSLCLLDEMVHDYNNLKSVYNKLKPYITDDTIAYRNLYEKLKELNNLTSFILAGNYDMLKLDDPTKGDDRRTKINDILDEVKGIEYCAELDGYLENDDVQYSFFWYCIDNHDTKFNELQELKLLPITETKKNMISKSLDSALTFLKDMMNNDSIMNKWIKPRDLYDEYALHNTGNKNILNKDNFLEKLKDLKDIISFEKKKINGVTTNYLYINRDKLITHFKNKHYFNEYDDIPECNNNVVIETTEDILRKENDKLKAEIETLKKLLSEQKVACNTSSTKIVSDEIELKQPVKVDVDSDSEDEDKVLIKPVRTTKKKVNKSLSKNKSTKRAKPERY